MKKSTFFTRLAEHMGISNFTGKRLKNVKKSAISDHLLQCNFTIMKIGDFSRKRTRNNTLMHKNCLSFV